MCFCSWENKFNKRSSEKVNFQHPVTLNRDILFCFVEFLTAFIMILFNIQSMGDIKKHTVVVVIINAYVFLHSWSYSYSLNGTPEVSKLVYFILTYLPSKLKVDTSNHQNKHVNEISTNFFILPPVSSCYLHTCS